MINHILLVDSSLVDMLESQTDVTNNYDILGIIASVFMDVFRFIFNLLISALHLVKGEFIDLGYKAADMFDGLNGQQILCDNFIYFIVGIVVFIFTFKLVFFFVGKITPG